jgi:hypothetical protein
MPAPDRHRIVWCTPGVADERVLMDSVRAAGWSIARECIDAADLLAAVTVEPDSVAVVSTTIQRVDAALWEELCARAIRVIVVDGVGGSAIPHSFPAGASGPIDASPGPLLGALGDLRPPNIESPDRQLPASRGTVIVVWGTSGAPGRTTIAIALSEACTRLGVRTLLVDADTHGPAIATSLAITEQSSGLLLACKHAEQGSLDDAAMGRAVRSLTPGLVGRKCVARYSRGS